MLKADSMIGKVAVLLEIEKPENEKRVADCHPFYCKKK
jgi:hypothetical protein